MDILILVVFGGMHCNHYFFLKVQVINDKFGIVEGLMTTVILLQVHICRCIIYLCFVFIVQDMLLGYKINL